MNHAPEQTPSQTTPGVPASVGYCATCRDMFHLDANPPYGVIHVSRDEHLHPLTREPLSRA